MESVVGATKMLLFILILHLTERLIFRIFVDFSMVQPRTPFVVTTTPQGYEEAIATLTERCGDPEHITSSHITSL